MKFRPDLDNVFKYLDSWEIRIITKTIAFEQEFNTVLPNNSFFKLISIRLAKKADMLADKFKITA